MIECDICGKKAKTRLITKNLDTNELNYLAEICDECNTDIAKGIANMVNKKMKEQYGDKALTIRFKDKDDKHTNGKEVEE